ncbi:MAG TPA: 16S rRNA (cytosine(1402)-N(4))-methyltransferase RsmH [Levilinea sp.]|nr:16S rRNA (cytosine(1402)-N(4))-methyltransferase RsmH [Levilinea sp.]
MASTSGNEPLHHIPVLYHDIIHALRPKSTGRYVDATVGAGGHAAGILEASNPGGQLLGFDLDPQALALAGQRLARYRGRYQLVQASYITLREQLLKLNWGGVDGVVLDLGVSSMQFDTPQRGFSFQEEGPLDMRFDPDQPLTASDLLNQLPEEELADILWKYGEEPQSRRIARAIYRSRPLRTTTELARVIQQTVGRPQGRIHPATRTFQAIRIAVNQELQGVEVFLPQAVAALLPAGRLAIISFHSLEDRLVKQYFRQQSRDCICPPQQPVCTCSHQAVIKEINRRPIMATEEETQKNPRARSARLRVVEKLDLA